jgi:hypothetical protein
VVFAIAIQKNLSGPSTEHKTGGGAMVNINALDNIIAVVVVILLLSLIVSIVKWSTSSITPSVASQSNPSSKLFA